VLEEFFSEFIFSGDSHFRRGLENFFCSGESVAFRRYSKKVFFEDFFFCSGESIAFRRYSKKVFFEDFFFCSGESIAFRRYSKKVFFEDFFFVLENQSHSEDAMIADGFMFGYRICGTLSLLRQKRGREERRERAEVPPKRRLHCAAKDTPRHTRTQSLRNKTMDV